MAVFDWAHDREELLELRDRVARLEEEVARLTAVVEAGIPAAGPLAAARLAADPLTADPLTEARALAADGRKVQAIKVVCDRTGMGLRQAKELVESW